MKKFKNYIIGFILICIIYYFLKNYFLGKIINSNIDIPKIVVTNSWWIKFEQ